MSVVKAVKKLLVDSCLVFFVMCTAQGYGEEFTERNNDHIVKTTGNESRNFVNPPNHSDLTQQL